EVVSPAPGLTIKLDGDALSSAALGTALPLDPGAHEIQVGAPGKKPWAQTVNLGPGAVTTRVEVPKLEDEIAAAAPAIGAPLSQSVPPTGADQRGNSGGPSSKRLAGFALGGAGIAGVGLAVFFGVRTVLFNNKSNDEASKANAEANPANQQIFIQAAQSDH